MERNGSRDLVSCYSTERQRDSVSESRNGDCLMEILVLVYSGDSLIGLR